MDLQSITPEIHVLPVVSGTNNTTSYRVPVTDYSTSVTSLNYDSKIPNIKVLSNNIAEAEDGSLVVEEGTISASDIKILYESNPDTNAYDDDSKNIVDGITNKVDTEIVDRQLQDNILQNSIATLSGTLTNYEHNSLKSLQGGDADIPEYYHLTLQKYNTLFPYMYSFSVSDWVGPTIGFYILTLVHNLNSNLIYLEVWDNSMQEVEIDRFIVDYNTISIRVPATPDLRFDGFIWVKII